MEIPEIKTHLSLHTVLQHYGLKPDRNQMLRCPFHDDQTPSMKIYPETDTFHCFGCGKSGDQIELCCLEEGDKYKGLIKATELAAGPSQPSFKEERQGMNDRGNHGEILLRIFRTFRHGLHHPVSVKPKEYLKSRGLNYERLEVGYNSGQFHHRGGLNEADKKACIEAGLLIPYSGSVPNANGKTYTPFARDCVIFPLKDKDGNMVSLYGRSITDNGKSKHYYLKNREGLYPGYPPPNTTKLILTEAIIDAATLLQMPEITEGYSVLSCYGTNGLTEEHLSAITEWAAFPHLGEGGREIIIFFDGDNAGRGAVEKYRDELQKLLPEITLSTVETPEGEDVNSLYVTYEKDAVLQLLDERKELFLLTENTETAESEPPLKIPAVQPKHALAQQGRLNTANPEFITYSTEELQITILGGINLQQLDRLRLTLKISRRTDGLHSIADPLHSIRHTLDLYHSDYLEKFIHKASEQLEMGTGVLKRAMAELTELVEAYRLSKIESQKVEKPKGRELTQERYKKAVNYLRASKLMERTGRDIGLTGMIGEENNRLLMYLIFTSRLREQPLHIISLGASGVGKTYLQERISELIPEHHKLEITILSENAFYYFGQQELKHKLVLIEDMDGAEHVLYPLRELQSKKKISKTIPIKDSKGNLKTITLKVEGPICLAGTTTKERLYEDNANRSLLIYLDSSKNHKEQIMKYQRKLSAGKIATEQEKQLIEFFKDMQTILKPVKVRNPFAEYLVIPEHVFKPLRTNSHYLAFIETITFYHQYQREVKTDPQTGDTYIETTLEDIEWANRLLKEVLLAKSDELSGESRRFFESLKSWMETGKKASFYKNEVRESFRMNPNNLKYYLSQLLRYNYLKIVGGNRHRSGYEYEVVNTTEYQRLHQSLNNALDAALEDIKKSLVDSKDNRRVTGVVIH